MPRKAKPKTPKGPERFWVRSGTPGALAPDKWFDSEVAAQNAAVRVLRAAQKEFHLKVYDVAASHRIDQLAVEISNLTVGWWAERDDVDKRHEWHVPVGWKVNLLIALWKEKLYG